MAYFNYKTEEDLAQSIKSNLSSRGITTSDGITGSISDVLASAIANEIYRIGEDFDIALSSESLENASGESLDLYASKYFAGQLTRIPESKAKADKSDFNILVVNATSEDVFLATGTELTNDTERDIAFLTKEDYTVSAYNSSYISIEAAEVGDDYNVSAGYLNSFSESISGVSVVQEKAITNGCYQESDEDFKNRIASLSSLNGLRTERLINFSGISYPGKFNARYYQNYFGPGISGVFQYYENTQPENSKQTLSEILREYSFETRELRELTARNLRFDIYSNSQISKTRQNEISTEIKNDYSPRSIINFNTYLSEDSTIRKIEIYKDDLYFDEINKIENNFYYESDEVELIKAINFIYEGN